MVSPTILIYLFNFAQEQQDSQDKRMNIVSSLRTHAYLPNQKFSGDKQVLDGCELVSSKEEFSKIQKNRRFQRGGYYYKITDPDLWRKYKALLGWLKSQPNSRYVQDEVQHAQFKLALIAHKRALAQQEQEDNGEKDKNNKKKLYLFA